MTPLRDDLRREIVSLLQQSADLKSQAQELLNTADDLRHKAERLKEFIEYADADRFPRTDLAKEG